MTPKELEEYDQKCLEEMYNLGAYGYHRNADGTYYYSLKMVKR